MVFVTNTRADTSCYLISSSASLRTGSARISISCVTVGVFRTLDTSTWRISHITLGTFYKNELFYTWYTSILKHIPGYQRSFSGSKLLKLVLIGWQIKIVLPYHDNTDNNCCLIKYERFQAQHILNCETMLSFNAPTYTALDTFFSVRYVWCDANYWSRNTYLYNWIYP